MSAIISFVDPASQEFTAVDFDVIMAEEHQIGARVSEHSVEEGANISDHVRPELIRLSLRGLVTDSPINQVTIGTSPGSLQGKYQPLRLTVGTNTRLGPFQLSGGNPTLTLPNGLSAPTIGQGPRSVTPMTFTPAEVRPGFETFSGPMLQFSSPIQRVKHVYQVLVYVCQAGIPVVVATDLKTYPSMLLTEVTAPRDGTDSIEFGMRLQELRTARTQTTTVRRSPAPKPKPAEKRAEPDTKDGKQGSKPLNLGVISSGGQAIINGLTKGAR